MKLVLWTAEGIREERTAPGMLGCSWRCLTATVRGRQAEFHFKEQQGEALIYIERPPRTVGKDSNERARHATKRLRTHER